MIRSRILHFSESSETGGAETVFLELVKRLDPSRFESHVVLVKEGWLLDRLAAGGHSPRLWPSRHGWDVSLWWRLRSLLRQAEIRLVHAHLPDSNAYGALAAIGSGVPVIATYHGLLRSRAERSAAESLKLMAVRFGARRVVAVSDALREQLIREAGFNPARLRRIYNGIDWDRFDGAGDGASVREELGLGPEARVVGMAANFKPEKGYPYFLRAASIVARACPAARFLIAGEGEERVQAELLDLSKQLGLEDRVQFLGYREDLPAVLRSLDVFVLSSLSEGMSIVTVEAMGAGLPVVVTRSGGPEELVEDGRSGLLVPPANSEQLAAGVLKVLEDRGLAQRLAAGARSSARARFNMNHMVSEYESLYAECLRNQGA